MEKRIIKFRAFLPVGEWIEPDEMEQKYEMVYDLAFEDYEPINDLLNKCENLMQFTGIKDKNGKEVFEGDVVKTATGEIAQVSWDDFFVGFTLKTISKWNPKSVWDDQVEIIGNVYENPELIEK